MSKKFKPKASSSRAAAGGFGAFGGFSTASSQSFAPSSLSYVAEPPDLSRISEPLLVVPFKNLSKKDDTTKTKALEDIKDHLARIKEQGGEVEEGVLEAWVKVYPRASIENARRIRHLAHIIQGQLASLAGKRIARHLPDVIGAWLAGLYDTDRVVSRTVAESISDVFPTEEKRNNLWRLFLGPILEFAEDVILHQTAKTLSDERIVKSDDAEAKFARVFATAILLLNRILSSSPSGQLEKHQELIETLLNSRNLWAFAHHEDSFARKAVYSILQTVVKGGLDIDWQVISSVLIGKAISTPQLGSAAELSETLLLITQTRPHFWTTDYTGKTSVAKRLQQYIKKGSQGAAESFWPNLVEILKLLPRETLAKYGMKEEGDKDFSYTQAVTLANDFSEGLGSRDEPRQNLTAGWRSFIELGLWLSAVLKAEEGRDLVRNNLLPIFEQYVLKPSQPSHYTLPSQTGEDICSSAFVRLIERGHQESLSEFWVHIAEALLEAVKLSRPEQSKEFRPSQDEVSAQATRFFTLQAAILSRTGETHHQPGIVKIFQTTNVPLLEGSLQVLHSRNGKPYAAAAVLEQAIRNVPEVVKNTGGLLPSLRELVPALLLSPSSKHIVSIILLCRDWEGFDTILEESLKNMTATESAPLSPAVLELLSAVNLKETPGTSDLISVVMKRLRKALDGENSDWSAVLAVSENPSLPDGVLDSIVTAIVDALSSESVTGALHGLSLLLDKSPRASKHLKSGVHGPKLIGKLIHLSESATDEIAHDAETLERRLKELVPKDVSTTSDLEVVRRHLLEVGPESLSVESLVNIAKELIQNCKADDIPNLGSTMLPSRETWKQSLEVFLALPPRRSSAITSPLGGAVNLIQPDLPESFSKNPENVARDSNNASAALRLTAFTTEILSSYPSLLLSIDQNHREGIFYYFPLAIQLIDDDLSIEGSLGITGLELPEDRDEYLGIVHRGRSIINNWINSNEASETNASGSLSEEFLAFWDKILKSLTDQTPESYRVGEAYARIMSQSESRPDTGTLVGLTREIRKMNAMRAAASLAVWGPIMLSSAAGTRLCNELVAEITGIDLEKDPVHGLTTMTLLNILAQEDRSVVGSIPTPRVVFLVKHIIECLQSGSGLSALAEGFKILAISLPALGEIFGSHWADSLDLLDKLWKETKAGDAEIPVLHASFRLFGLFNSMANGDGNDDLEDAWKDSKGKLFESLVSLLSRIDSASEHNQPRDMTVDLLRRQLNTISIEKIPNVRDLFPLLAVQCSAIQRTAFEVLHRYIPKAQQEVSFEVALSKTTVHLPDELLSLLLEPPRADALSANARDAGVWVGLRSHLLSWKIVFDHFANSSVPVQENYAADIKEHGALNPLLEFTFEFLEKGGKLIDASKFKVKTFELDESESSEKEIQWLLVHLYFLSLKHLPILTKSWWLDSKKKIKGLVEAWTEKYISPSIIEEALQGVVDWIQTQDKDEERPLTVKVSWNTAELVASIVVDDESPPVAIAVNLPRAYPLQPAVVTGRSRALVDEKKWQNWLLIIQGVIMFSHNLVDGLLAFRRNVQGVFKGQSECAICYSVISTDMQMPNRRCATCKNAFHSVCLFRWFKSSNQSTCPLCRNYFVYV